MNLLFLVSSVRDTEGRTHKKKGVKNHKCIVTTASRRAKTKMASARQRRGSRIFYVSCKCQSE